MEPSAPAVLHALARACSQDAAALRPAEQQLKEWETCRGFYSSLLLVFSDRSLDTNVRWLAVLCLKNGIDRYWRRTAPNAIEEAEKSQLRERLLHCAVLGTSGVESLPQLATQLALVIGKVARIDCPSQWPELLPALLDALMRRGAGADAASDPSVQQQQHVLAIFYQVVKCMASRRLAHDRKVFEDVTTGVFRHVLEAWHRAQESLEARLHLAAVASPGGAGSVSTAVATDLEHGLLTLKVLRKLTVFGCKHPGQQPDAAAFLHASLVRFERLCDDSTLLALAESDGRLAACRRRMLLLVSKLLLDMLEFHPTSFVPLLQPSLALAYKYCFTDAGSSRIFEPLAVNLLNVVREIVVSEEYKPPKVATATSMGSGPATSGDSTNVHPAAPVASRLLAEFFRPDIVLAMGRRLVCDYFPMTAADLSLWDADPEHFVAEESGGDSLKFSLRPCAEAAYLVLLKANRPLLGSQLVQLLAECCGTSAAAAATSDSSAAWSADDLGLQLRREAVYRAVGLACFDLYEDVDFDSLVAGPLLGELRVAPSHSVYRLVRRRVVWLLGRLHGVRLSPAVQPSLYDAVEASLASGEDLVVRLEAAATLRSLLDDFEFDADRFAPRLGRVLALLCALLGDAAAADTRLQVLHAVSFVVERSGSRVRPHTAALLDGCLVPLWQLAATGAGVDERGMLRCAVACCLAHLVRGLGPSLSRCVYSLALPVVRLAVDPSDAAHVYLLDDGLELWEALLQNAPDAPSASVTAAADESAIAAECHAGLLALCGAVPRLICELASESLRACARIVEAYLALDGQAVLADYGRLLADCLTKAAFPTAGLGGTELKPEGLIVVLKVVEVFFAWHAPAACQLFAELMVHVVGALLGGERTTEDDDGVREEHDAASEEEDDDGDDEPETHPAVLGAYCSLLARAAVREPTAVMAYAAEVVRRGRARRRQRSSANAVDGAVAVDRVVDRLLARWVECIDRMSQPEKRKLSALGLAALLRSPSRAAFDRLPEVVGVCVQVLCDVCQLCPDGRGGQFCVDTLVQQATSSTAGATSDGLVGESPPPSDDEDDGGRTGGDSGGGDTEHDRRKRRLLQVDPVFSVSLADYVMQTLGAMEQWQGSLGGGSLAAKLQADVDPTVLLQLTSFLSVLPAATAAATALQS